VPLRAGALIAILAAAVAQASAQSTSDTDRFLMRPVIDGDPDNPQRFRRPGSPVPSSTPSRIGQVPSFSYRPGLGAGATGFVSTNAKRQKGKGAPKAKAGSAGRSVAAAQAPAAPAASTASASSAASTTPTTAAASTASMAGAPVPLPPLTQPATTIRQERAQRLIAPSVAYAGVSGDTPPVPTRKRLPVDPDPFAPLGIQVGAFNLRPAVELTGAHDSNPARTGTPTPSWYWLAAPELLVNSNWARHELTANLRGTYTNYEDTSEINRPSFDGRVNGRVDVTTTTRLNLEARYLVGTDSPGSPNIQVGLARLPIFTTLGGTAGITQQFNRFEATAKGGVDRTLYQDSRFLDGETSSNADRDYIRYNAALRGAYEVTPGAKPFVELAGDSRHYDLLIDASGVNRNSQGFSAKAGTTIEYSQKLVGEASVGYLTRHYQDPSLQSFSGLLLDGTVTWFASALTTFKFVATTSVSESTVSGVSGVFTRELSMQIDHAFRRWLIATGKFSFGIDDYEGSPRLDKRYAASLLLTYKMTRELWLKAEYRHEWLNSSEPANNWVADVVLLGVRLQR
jgi:hypothetical protein